MEAKEKFLLISVSVFLSLIVSPVFAAPDDLKIYDSLFGGKQIFGIPLIQSVNNSGCSGAPSLGSFSCGSSSGTSGTLPAADQTKWHKVYISSSGTLNISMSGPGGTDFDLLVFSACGSGSICSSTSTSSTEKCTISASAGNYYYIAVYSFTGSGSYSLNAALSCAAPPSCDSFSYTSCSSAYSLSNNSAKSGMCGANQYYKISTTKNCTLAWTMTPQSGSDYDLYVKNSAGSCPSISSWDCRPYAGAGSAETCKAFLPAGTYYALVNKYSGTSSYSIKAVISNCTTTCTNHSSYSCYNNDVYWYNSCSQRQEMKQDCGDSSNGTWGSNYCRTGNVYHNRTVYNKGCSGNSCYSTTSVTSELVQNCGGYGCVNGTCIRPLNVTIMNYTGYVESGYFGAIQWNTSGEVKETGVYYAYNADKGDAVKVNVSPNNYSVYAGLIAPKYQACTVYVKAYAIAKNGTKKETDWKTVSFAQYCIIPSLAGNVTFILSIGACNESEIPFEFEDLDLTQAGIDVAKFLTIGSCLDEGWLTWWCAFDVGTFVPVVADGPLPFGDVVASGLKMIKLSAGSKVLMALGSVSKLGTAVRKMKLTINGIKYSVEGWKVKRAHDLGILVVDATKSGKITTSYKALTEWFLKYGDEAISALKNKLFSNSQMDRYIANGVDLNKLKSYAESSKWSADEVDEAVTIARAVEKAKGTNAITQMLDNGYEISRYVPETGKYPDLYLKNVGGKEITIEAKGIDNTLTTTTKLTDTLYNAQAQLTRAPGERIAVVVTRQGTALSDTTIANTVKDWLLNSDSGKAIDSVVVHITEDKLIYITR